MNTGNADPVLKAQERARLAEDVAEFLRRGGVIETIEGPRPGVQRPDQEPSHKSPQPGQQ